MPKLIHTMLRVRDEQRSLDFYKSALDLDVTGRFAFEGFTLLYLRNAATEFEIELTVNHDRDRPYELGDGYGHMAVVTDDLDGEHARLMRQGLQPLAIKEFAGGSLNARFFFVSDPDGYKIEFLQRAGRFR